MDDPASTHPDHFHSRETGLPLDLDLSRPDWQLISPAGARQRGWGDNRLDPAKVEKWLRDAIRLQHEAPFETLHQQIVQRHGELAEADLLGAAERLVQRGQLLAFPAPLGDDPEQQPAELIDGTRAMFQHLQPTYHLISPAEAASRGWGIAVCIPLMPAWCGTTTPSGSACWRNCAGSVRFTVAAPAPLSGRWS